FHTQIVVCPGINDGPCLEKTINDLLAFEQGLLSIAVVPVGLTKHRKKQLRPFGRESARAVCSMVNRLSAQDMARKGVRRLFIADEFFLKAGEEIPATEYYEDFPQIENGVGLIRLLLTEWDGIKNRLPAGIPTEPDTRKPLLKSKRYLILTSVSADPYLRDIIGEMNRVITGVELFTAPVINTFFGESVTVAGLIAARDIIRTVRRADKRCDVVIIPRVILNYRGFTLDGFSIKRIAKELHRRVEAVHSLSQLLELISGNGNGRERNKKQRTAE
ncbi:MAG: DUF512 domain-containing protein, partial [Ignavibacteria bacterium]|nr:DUF512 domain-containing protein [Ignavibacteria bacterium]